jgi:hypothetical protein
MFHIWPQMDEILKFNLTPIDLALQLHPHTMRYLLIYPCLVLADLLGVHRDILYSLLVYGCWAGTFYLSYSILEQNKISNLYINLVHFLMTTLYFCGLFFSNGRGVLAVFGVMLLFFIEYKRTELKVWKKISGLSFSFLLCNVSTGIVFCFSMGVLLTLLMNFRIKNFRSLLLIGAVFLILTYFICVSLEKNMSYYGSILSMLSHGLPGVFSPAIFKYGMVFAILSFSYFTHHTLNKEFGVNVVMIFIIYILGGLFGQLTFLVVLPAMLTAFLFHYIKKYTPPRIIGAS